MDSVLIQVSQKIYVHQKNLSTWRHDSVLSYIVSTVDPTLTVSSDIPGHTAPAGGSIPPQLCVTVQKPEKVIINKEK